MIKTNIVSLAEVTNLPSWWSFFSAGDAWLQTYYVIEDNKDKIYTGVFWVKPWVVAFCLELMVKGIASFYDIQFDGHKYMHHTSRIICDYAGEIDIFQDLSHDSSLMEIIRMYEKTIDTKYAETGGNGDGDEQQRLVDLIHSLRAELSKLTGLR